MKQSRLLLFLDLTLFVVLFLTIDLRLTGLSVHEWLGLSLIIVLAAHLYFGWPWIATTARKLGRGGTWRGRVNFLLNTFLFVLVAFATVTGLMASMVALPVLGLTAADEISARAVFLHSRSHIIVLLFLFIGLHIAMNWRWIMDMVRKTVKPGHGAR